MGKSHAFCLGASAPSGWSADLTSWDAVLGRVGGLIRVVLAFLQRLHSSLAMAGTRAGLPGLPGRGNLGGTRPKSSNSSTSYLYLYPGPGYPQVAGLSPGAHPGEAQVAGYLEPGAHWRAKRETEQGERGGLRVCDLAPLHHRRCRGFQHR